MTSTDIKINLYNSIKEEREERVYNNWGGSSLAKCPRMQYMSRLGVPPVQELTGAKLMRFQAGNILEDFIRPHLVKQFPELRSNERIISDELDLSGEFDNYDPVSKRLIEIKSVHVFAPKHLEKDNKPYFHHEYQQHAYKLLLEAQGEEVDVITYVYISLDGQLVVFNTEPSEEIESNVRKRLKLLHDAWEKQEPPICICQQENHPLWKSEMRYCNYRTIDVNPPKLDPSCCDLKLIDNHLESELKSEEEHMDDN